MKKTYPTIDSKDITVADFPIYRAIMTQNENSRIKDEYLEIQCYAEQLNTSTAIAKQNEILNRYLNISPFDYNRVILDKPGCDYINASYIHVRFKKINMLPFHECLLLNRATHILGNISLLKVQNQIRAMNFG